MSQLPMRDVPVVAPQGPHKANLRGKNTIAAVRSDRAGSAYQRLRELIVHGRLAPGSSVIEADLATRLGVSRAPVREALRLLQQEGFVIRNPAGATKSRLVVAPLTKEDARELYWIVSRLEGMAAQRTAALRPSVRKELAKELELLNEGLRNIAQTGWGNPDRVFELDRRFHRTIVEATTGPRLLALHNSIKPQTERYWRLYANAIVDQLSLSVAEHECIIRAIGEGDGDAAEHALKVNWQKGAERLSKVIDTLGERGSW